MDKMNEADIKKEIAKIIDKRSDDINRILATPGAIAGKNSSNSTLKKTGFDEPTWWAIYVGIWIGYGLAAFIILLLICYILYKSYKSSFVVKSIIWIMLLVSYSASVFYVHDTVFDGYTNNFNMSLSFIPIAITLLLLFIYPNITKPLDNTVGYFCVTRAPFVEGLDVMKKFKSRLFPKENMLDGLGNEISFDWLITTFDSKHIESCLNQMKKDQEFNVTNGSILTDFYIDTPSDELIDGIKHLVELKRTFGRGAGLLIAATIGLAGSMVYSVPLKITLV
jgi:hypothetical protein